MKLNLYERTIHGKCPVDGADDEYAVKIRSRKLIPAEEINEVLDRWDGAVLTQEAITKRILRDLGDHDCIVRLVGVHSGLKITSIRS